MRQLPYVVPRAQRGLLNTLALIVVAIIIFGAMLYGSGRVLDATSAEQPSLQPSEVAQHGAFGSPRRFSGPGAQLYSCDHGEAGAFDPSMCGLVRDVRAEMIPQLVEALDMATSTQAAGYSAASSTATTATTAEDDLGSADGGGEEPTSLSDAATGDGQGQATNPVDSDAGSSIDGDTTARLVDYSHRPPRVTATFYSAALVRRVTTTCSLFDASAPTASSAPSRSSDSTTTASAATRVMMSANPSFEAPSSTSAANKPVHDTFGSAVPTAEPEPTHAPPTPHTRTLAHDDPRRLDPEALQGGGWAACTTPSGVGVIVHDLRLDPFAAARR